MFKEFFAHLSPRLVTTLAVCFGIFLLCAIGFVALAEEVYDGDTLFVDQTILRAINAQSTDALDAFFLSVTNLGGVYGVAVISVVAFTMLLARKMYRRAILFAAGIGGAAVLNVVLKLLFERPRPDLWEHLVVETSFSFPSGHAMASSALAFCFIALSWRTRYRWVVVIAALLFTVIIGLSRLYLGVHYPTDIIAGWLVSAAWVLIVVAIVQGWRLNSVKSSKSLDATII